MGFEYCWLFTRSKDETGIQANAYLQENPVSALLDGNGLYARYYQVETMPDSVNGRLVADFDATEAAMRFAEKAAELALQQAGVPKLHGEEAEYYAEHEGEILLKVAKLLVTAVRQQQQSGDPYTAAPLETALEAKRYAFIARAWVASKKETCTFNRVVNAVRNALGSMAIHRLAMSSDKEVLTHFNYMNETEAYVIEARRFLGGHFEEELQKLRLEKDKEKSCQKDSKS